MDIRSLCRVVIKFREAGPAALDHMQELLARYPGTTGHPLFTSVPPDTIARWTEKARQASPGYLPPDFTAYHALECPHEDQAALLSRQLNAHEAVALAYVEQGFADAPAMPSGPAPGSRQGYLNPAPEGIDAHYAWRMAGGNGSGAVRYIDIEQGWLPHHEAVALHLLPCTGINNRRLAEHGTAVLGIIGAQPGEAGLIGIAPHAHGYAVSQWRPGGAFNTADAVMAAIGQLQWGDVLLIEAQTWHTGTLAKTWPVEVHEACYQSIRLATALGIIVIEPAGNGSTGEPAGNDLDSFFLDGKSVLNPLSADFRDSGAIMVTAATSTVPHVRLAWSNYGRRINCYAWGESVRTAGSHPRSSGMAINTYTAAFGGTSAASAIVAGAAISLQSIAEANHHFRLSPQQMRSLLGDENSGTASAGGRWEDKIGVMPNLQKMISQALLLQPPHTGRQSFSK